MLSFQEDFDAMAARELQGLNADIEAFASRGSLSGRCHFTETSRRLGLLSRVASCNGNVYKSYRCAMSMASVWSDRDLWECAARVEKRKHEDGVPDRAGFTPLQ